MTEALLLGDFEGWAGSFSLGGRERRVEEGEERRAGEKAEGEESGREGRRRGVAGMPVMSGGRARGSRGSSASLAECADEV